MTNTLDDGSAGSLRWAVNQANATNGADTIEFDTAGSSITLTRGDLTIVDDLAIFGPMTIGGNGASRVFNIDNENPALGARHPFVVLENLALHGGVERSSDGGRSGTKGS